MTRIEEFNNKFLEARIKSGKGVEIASKTITAITAIEEVITLFTNSSQDAELMAYLAEILGANELEYSGKVAHILGEALGKINALET